jgi:hypothetical protein
MDIVMADLNKKNKNALLNSPASENLIKTGWW